MCDSRPSQCFVSQAHKLGEKTTATVRGTFDLDGHGSSTWLGLQQAVERDRAALGGHRKAIRHALYQGLHLPLLEECEDDGDPAM
jgi:hypothetical protein